MRIRPLERAQAAESVRGVYDELERRYGRVPDLFKMLGHKPEVLRTFDAFYQAVWAAGELPGRLKVLAYLRASVLNGCAY